MKTAAIVNPYWDTLGGGERYTAAFIRFLLDNHWQVDVRWPAELSVAIRNHFDLDISGAHFLPGLNQLQNYDLVFWVSDGSLPTSRARQTIVHFQFPFQNIGGRSWANLLKSRFYSFVVNSQFTKQFIDREFSVKSRVIYPPVSVDKFPAGKKENTILYVGRFSHLVQNKHHDVLIRSFKNISARHPNWKLVLAGGTSVGASTDGVGELKKLATGLPVEFVFDPDFPVLQSLYSRASIFWSASGYSVNEMENPLLVEHFGISLVEAMSAGCVPLAIAKGGHKEIIDTGINGYLWDQTSELEMLTEKLISDNKLLSALSHAAREKSKIFSTAEFDANFKRLIHL